MQLTAGGNRLEYNGKKSTKTASLETIKILWNSVLSTKDTRFVVANIGNMYLNKKLPSPEYMKIHVKFIPAEIISEYNVMQIVDDEGFDYVEITGTIYGLTQSGYLAHQDLIKNLNRSGSSLSPESRASGITKPGKQNLHWS